MLHVHLRRYRTALSIFLLTAYGCNSTAEGQLGEGQLTVTAQGAEAGSCHHTQFSQPVVTQPKLDLLFVVDTSGSLEEEKARLVDGIDQFVSALPRHTDYQFAVVLGHGSLSSLSGKVWRYSTEPRVLKSSELSFTEIRAHLGMKLVNTPGDYWADGGEEGLYSLNKAVTTHLSLNRDYGFFREDAALAVMFVSDENDICAEIPEGAVTAVDEDGLEEPARIRDCGGVSANSVFSNLQSVQSGNSLMVSGILYSNPDTMPAVDENGIGYGYLDLIDLSGGPVADIALSDYRPGLEEIGNAARMAVELIKEYHYNNLEIDPSTVQVRVDGEVVPFEILEDHHLIRIDDPGVPGSVVDLDYCEKTPTEGGEQDGGGAQDDTEPSEGGSNDGDGGSDVGDDDGGNGDDDGGESDSGSDSDSDTGPSDGDSDDGDVVDDGEGCPITQCGVLGV